MSDPVSNDRVEDVLASVRRLVSHEDRSENNRGANAEDSSANVTGSERDSPPAAGDRLILTPSLRVSGAEGKLSDAQAESQRNAGAGAIVPPADFAAKEPVTEFSEPGATFRPSLERHKDAAIPAKADEGSSVTAADVDADKTTMLRLDASARLPEKPEDGPRDTSGPVADPLDHHASAATGSPSENLARTEADPAMVRETPDHAREGAKSGSEGSPASEKTSNHRDEDEIVFADVAPEQALKAKIAALEAAIAQVDQASRADRVEDEARPADSPSEIVDRPASAEDAQHDEPYLLKPEARQDDPNGDTAVSESERHGALPEDDVLRKLVAEIVRQELQGVLGERITRNVRKLVRREILRALASKDFD